MTTKAKRKAPEIVLSKTLGTERDGKPAAVILDIAQYREMLERMRKRPMLFSKLGDFLTGHNPAAGGNVG